MHELRRDVSAFAGLHVQAIDDFFACLDGCGVAGQMKLIATVEDFNAEASRDLAEVLIQLAA